MKPKFKIGDKVFYYDEGINKILPATIVGDNIVWKDGWCYLLRNHEQASECLMDTTREGCKLKTINYISKRIHDFNQKILEYRNGIESEITMLDRLTRGAVR